jgi:hypothetical protein
MDRDAFKFVSVRGADGATLGSRSFVNRKLPEATPPDAGTRPTLEKLESQLKLVESLESDVGTEIAASAIARELKSSSVRVKARGAGGQRSLGLAAPADLVPFKVDMKKAVASKSAADVAVLKGLGISVTGSLGIGDVFSDLKAVEDDLVNAGHAFCAASAPAHHSKDPGRKASARATVVGIGMADLMKVVEKVVGYEVLEIADAENVLPGEQRSHVVTKLSELEVETLLEERIVSSESTRSMRSDRSEFSSESTRTIESSFAVDAGVNVSTKYGPTKVDASLDTSFSRTSSDSKSSAASFAQEVAEETVKAVTTSVLESRRVLTHELAKSVAKKGIDRTADKTGYTGLYFWLNKIVELQVRQWGTRLMLEFMIRDPSETALTQPPSRSLPEPPPALNIQPSDINRFNYMCLAKRFRTADVVPPPPLYKSVSWAWKSEPNEDADDNKQDTATDKIEIPAGYEPSSARVIVAGHEGDDNAEWFVDLGGETAFNALVPGSAPSKVDLQRVETDSGISVALRVFDHRDKTGVANVFIKCVRSEGAYRRWQLRCWDAYLEGHRLLEAAFIRLTETATYGADDLPTNEHPTRLRHRERTELKKWAIEGLRNVAGVAPNTTQAEARAVRFYEQAFEWEQMTYLFYGYSWGTEGLREALQDAQHNDPTHEAFLRAGAARVLVAVTPGYESRVVNFLESNQPEANRVVWSPPNGYVPTDSDLSAAWQEIIKARDEDLVTGVGALKVANGSPNATSVQANDGSGPWNLSSSDVGRDIIIAGEHHRILSVNPPVDFVLETPFDGTTSSNALFLIGSRPMGTPWRIVLPSDIVVLWEGLQAIKSLPSWIQPPAAPAADGSS